MAGEINIKVEGLDKILRSLSKFPNEIAKYLGHAGEEAANRVIYKTPGLGVGKAGYPPATQANFPPTPFYERGIGMHYANKVKHTSERFGTNWYTETKGFATEIGNNTSYGKYLVGEQQARAMARIGWKQLYATAKSKMGDIVKVYQAWVNKLIHDLGL